MTKIVKKHIINEKMIRKHYTRKYGNKLFQKQLNVFNRFKLKKLIQLKFYKNNLKNVINGYKLFKSRKK